VNRQLTKLEQEMRGQLRKSFTRSFQW